MKLRFICQVVGVMTIVAILIEAVGNGLMYMPHFGIFLSPMMILRLFLPVLCSVIGGAGLIVFLAGFCKQLRTGIVPTELYTLAGVCILIAMLISSGSYLFQIKQIFRHLGFVRSLLYTLSMGLGTLTSLLISIFFFRHVGSRTALKNLGTTILTLLILIIFIFLINTALYLIKYPFENIQDNILSFGGYCITIFGYLIDQVAGVVFMIAYLAWYRPELAVCESDEIYDE